MTVRGKFAENHLGQILRQIVGEKKARISFSKKSTTMEAPAATTTGEAENKGRGKNWLSAERVQAILACTTASLNAEAGADMKLEDIQKKVDFVRFLTNVAIFFVSARLW